MVDLPQAYQSREEGPAFYRPDPPPGNQIVDLVFYADTGLVFPNPGTSYTEIHYRIRKYFDFSVLSFTHARIMGNVNGGEAGTHGLALYKDPLGTPTMLCEVTWSGTGWQWVVGSWTAISETTDQLLSLYCKGSSPTDDLTFGLMGAQLKMV